MANPGLAVWTPRGGRNDWTCCSTHFAVPFLIATPAILSYHMDISSGTSASRQVTFQFSFVCVPSSISISWIFTERRLFVNHWARDSWWGNLWNKPWFVPAVHLPALFLHNDFLGDTGKLEQLRVCTYLSIPELFLKSASCHRPSGIRPKAQEQSLSIFTTWYEVLAKVFVLLSQVLHSFYFVVLDNNRGLRRLSSGLDTS